MLAHLVLGEVTDGEPRRRQLRLGERPQEIRLVLAPIAGAAQLPETGRRVALDPRVVAGGDGRRVPRLRAGQERAELEVAVAADARHRRASAAVALAERRDHGALELLGHVEDVVGDGQRAGDPPGVVDRLRPAAEAEPARRLGRRLPRPYAHRHADRLVTGLDQQSGGDGRIDASAHPDDDALGRHEISLARRAMRSAARAPRHSHRRSRCVPGARRRRCARVSSARAAAPLRPR